jgi:hypothetical protein
MSQAPSPAPSLPALSPAEVRLLLLLSRPALTAAQQERARELVPQVEDWLPLVDTAWRKYVLPMVFQNLAGLGRGGPRDDVFAMMRPHAIRMTSDTLRRHAAFDRFHERCVLAAGVPYAYFKGRALAARFYPDPTQRFFRDTDILVRREHAAAMLRRMLDDGCRVFLETHPDREIDLSSDKRIVEFLHMNAVPNVVTPEGQVVELHREIDPHTRLFDTGELLRAAQETSTQNHRIKVLPDAPHIVFVCYHHTRHLWSKLNWIADLGAICASPRFDRKAVLDHARRLRIESTVVAALELHDLVSAGLHPSDLDRATPGGDLLRACVDGLVGDDELEEQMREGQVLRVLSFAWQEMPLSRWGVVRLKMRRLRPRFPVYLSMPGGRRMRWMRYALATGIRLQRFVVRRLTEVYRR